MNNVTKYEWIGKILKIKHEGTKFSSLYTCSWKKIQMWKNAKSSLICFGIFYP
jgi:hypothetical protein